jgi:hypothetical protein
LIHLFDLVTWTEVLAVLNDAGPAERIRRVRAAEAGDPRPTFAPDQAQRRRHRHRHLFWTSGARRLLGPNGVRTCT